MRAGQCQTFLTLPQSLSTVGYIQLWVRGIGQLGVLDSAGAASGGAEVMNTGGVGPRTASMEEDLSSSAERSLQCSLPGTLLSASVLLRGMHLFSVAGSLRSYSFY